MKEFSVHLGSAYHPPQGKEAVTRSVLFDLRPASMVNCVPGRNIFLLRSQEPRAILEEFYAGTAGTLWLNFALG